jgi:hypothetical protein
MKSVSGSPSQVGHEAMNNDVAQLLPLVDTIAPIRGVRGWSL